jgi:hypothetical protein
MPDNRRLRRLLAYALAVPVIAVVYAAAFGSRAWNVLRPFVATFLGVTVIGGVYADEALKRAPATPLRAAIVVGLAVVLVSPNVAPTPVYAADDPAQAVISAAKQYLDHPYQGGGVGPRYFDCSGLVFRAFSDAGELPRIGGMRLLSQGYMRWFVARGEFTTDQTEAVPGDLVVWNGGSHIGIYLGNGKAISALINPWGVTIHGLHWIGEPVTYFLKVDYSNGDGNGDGTASGGGSQGSDGNNNGNNNGNNPGDNNNGNNPGDNGTPTTEPVTPDSTTPDAGNPLAGGKQGSSENSIANGSDFAVVTNAGDTQQPTASDTAGPPAPSGKDVIGAGYTTATLEIHDGPHADSRVVGWITRNVDFAVVDQTNSSGWKWLQIQLISGKTGWIWAYWTNLR